MSDFKPTSAEFRVQSPSRSSSTYFLLDFPLFGNFQQLEFQWVKKEKVKAKVHVAISDSGDAVSLPGLPFGGILTEGSIKTDELEQFIFETVEDLRRRSCTSFSVIQPPKPYEPLSQLIENILFKMGFVQESVQSHQFFLGKKRIKKQAKTFEEKLKKEEEKSDTSVIKGKISNFNFLQDIKKWNSDRGYQMAFDENRLIQQVSLFPDRYFQISVLCKSKPVAHAVAVKLMPESLYYFLSAIDPKAKIPNCGDRVLHSLFQLAAEQKSEFIDLGSSETESGINHGLMFFKSRFSNDISNKVTWKLRFRHE
ncbi:hypothetical protein [Algoriphagus sp. AK58]|uniref:hypothetical protein n=1 Tax=Algoriphagus sp. AK58 TaxID=1406877 RepID=UPI001650BA92|nr:hypothetical protein [Algoriphagus sp. AK58]